MQEFYDGYEAFQTKKLLQNEERESIEDTVSESYSKEVVETAAAIEAENGMDASEYILPDSDTRCLTEEDVTGLSEEEIRIALNVCTPRKNIPVRRFKCIFRIQILV